MRRPPQNLEKAAEMMPRSRPRIQLRYLQTLVEIGSEKNTTVVFPLPHRYTLDHRTRARTN